MTIYKSRIIRKDGLIKYNFTRIPGGETIYFLRDDDQALSQAASLLKSISEAKKIIIKYIEEKNETYT